FWPLFFFFQAEDGIRDFHVTGVQTCALPISENIICFSDMESRVWERIISVFCRISRPRNTIPRITAKLAARFIQSVLLFLVLRSTNLSRSYTVSVRPANPPSPRMRSEEHTSELQS